MKKCDQCKDLILTDFMDGRLDKHLKETLESHLLDCGDCRSFFNEVKNNTVMPFQRVGQEAPPVELWDRIKEGISQENAAPSPWENLIGQLKGLMVFPKMVPVFASLVLMFIVGTVSLNDIRNQDIKAQAQGEYLVSLLAPSSAGTSESNDFGTSIEHYFL